LSVIVTLNARCRPLKTVIKDNANTETAANTND